MSSVAEAPHMSAPIEPGSDPDEAERPLVFECSGETLLGILHRAAHGAAARPGVLIVVGGPQYRVGSHRQFTQLARALAAGGYPALRFDCRGMGDSSGEFPGFEHIGPDIRAALDALTRAVPGLPGVVIFGLCDAAAAALLYCRSDSRVGGLVLANPWVRSDSGEAQSYVKHYYGQRLLQASFWGKLLTGRLELWASVVDFSRKLVRARAASEPAATGNFIDRMLLGFESFDRHTLFLLSGRDLTAQEFHDLYGSSSRWGAAMRRPGVTVCPYPQADHTFSSAGVRDESIAAILQWLNGRQT